MTWIVARTQPRRERWAAENIKRQGASPYFPMYLESGKPTPLFPSYLFVELQDERWRFLLGTFGVTGVIMGSGGGPAFLREEIVQALRKRESNGVVRLPELPAKLRPGANVRVASGPLAGKSGIYQDSTPAHRERVLIEVLGRMTPVFIGEEALEAI